MKHLPRLSVLIGISCLVVASFSFSTHVRERSTAPAQSVSAETVTQVRTPTPTPQATTTPVRVPIVTYHGVRDTEPTEAADVRQFNVAPALLREELQYLIDNDFTPITFAELSAYFDTSASLPEKPIIITFDDGWRSQYVNALPILRELGVRATFFLFPNALGHETFMSWDEARELVTAGMEIGSHSTSHLYMTKQPAEDLPREIAGSKQWLEEELGTAVDTFSYPFGLYNATSTKAVHEAGYTTARTLAHTTMHSRDTRFELGSYLVGNNISDFIYIIDTVDR